ncbi:ATP-binding protein [Streptomyces sp. AcH 505]|uniref:ATP-binding protein n=1 Tax=Streptomyces sp. AcH 505 TaxID=352211 RepID=UPI0005A8E5F5
MPATQQTQVVVTVRAFVQRFSATRRGARLARVLALQQLDAWGVPYDSEASDAVALVVAELASNAVLHGRVTGRGFAVRLAYEPDAAFLRVEVSDTHDALPGRGDHCVDSERGRGLVIVEALALRWGVSGRSGPGKTVWAVIAVGAGVAGVSPGGPGPSVRT